MKSLIKSVGLVALTGLLIFLGTQLLFTQEATPIRPTRPPRAQDTTKTPEPVQKETYVSEVILQAPWATRSLVYGGEESPPGKFGLNVYEIPDSLKEELPAPPLPEGPTSFTVAPNGDIYITDPLNYRIQRFNPEGQFVSAIPRIKGWVWKWKTICVDQDNNVYLRWDEPDKLSVLKYDQTGKLLSTYPIFEGWGGPAGTGLYCDNTGRLFFHGNTYVQDERRQGKKVFQEVTFQFGTRDQVFNAEQQRATIRRGVIGCNDLREFKLYFKNSTTREFVQNDSLGNITKRFPATIRGLFIGADEEGKIYTESADHDLNKKKMTWFIWKWDEKGNLISTIQWNTTIGETWGSDYWWGERRIIDKRGNLYIYYSTKEAIIITKWYKQP